MQVRVHSLFEKESRKQEGNFKIARMMKQTKMVSHFLYLF